MKVITYSEVFPNYAERMQFITNQTKQWAHNPVALYFALNEPMHARVTTALNAKEWLGDYSDRY